MHLEKVVLRPHDQTVSKAVEVETKLIANSFSQVPVRMRLHTECRQSVHFCKPGPDKACARRERAAKRCSVVEQLIVTECGCMCVWASVSACTPRLSDCMSDQMVRSCDSHFNVSVTAQILKHQDVLGSGFAGRRCPVPKIQTASV